MQASCEEDRDFNRVRDSSANLPIVNSSCTSQLSDWEIWIPRVQENGMDFTAYLSGLLNRFFSVDVNDLDYPNTR